jgi:alkylhydroperoxidase/carboxymuconolactone decarboxylase family protein YurZ
VAKFEETLRRLAVFDEQFVKAGFGLDLPEASTLDAKTAALLQVAVSVAGDLSAVCVHWSVGRALAAGASEDEITDVLLAIAPLAGVGRVVSATPEVAAGLGYDVAAALMEPNGR